MGPRNITILGRHRARINCPRILLQKFHVLIHMTTPKFILRHPKFVMSCFWFQYLLIHMTTPKFILRHPKFVMSCFWFQYFYIYSPTTKLAQCLDWFHGCERTVASFYSSKMLKHGPLRTGNVHHLQVHTLHCQTVPIPPLF